MHADILTNSSLSGCCLCGGVGRLVCGDWEGYEDFERDEGAGIFLSTPFLLTMFL